MKYLLVVLWVVIVLVVDQIFQKFVFNYYYLKKNRRK